MQKLSAHPKDHCHLIPLCCSKLFFQKNFYLLMYLFILFYLLLAVLVATRAFLCLRRAGPSPWLPGAGFSGWYPLLVRSPGRRRGAEVAVASLPRGMWNPLGPGIEPASPALQGNIDDQGNPVQSFSKILFLEIFSRSKESILTPIAEL